MKKNRVERNSAQGSLEYLLMIGAAVLIVAVVIVVLSGIIVDTKDQNSTSDYNSQMKNLTDLKKDNQTTSKNMLPSISSFSVEGVFGSVYNDEITIILPYDSSSNLSSIEPTIVARNGTISPSGAQDFTKGPVLYKVISKDGNFKEYYVSITKDIITNIEDKKILEIYTTDSLNFEYNNSTKTYSFSVDYMTDLTQMNLFFVVSNRAFIKRVVSDKNAYYCDYNSMYGLDLTYNCNDNLDPTDFTNPVKYVVTARDGTTQEYFVKINLLPAKSDKEITSFEFDAFRARGIIDEVNNLISVSVPRETNLTNLVPRVRITGVSVSPEAFKSVNFSSPVEYTVTAQDGSTQKYIVTVTADAPIWSGEYTISSYSNAINTCATWGGRLPTKEEICRMIEYSSYPQFLNTYCVYYYWTGTVENDMITLVSDGACSGSCSTAQTYITDTYTRKFKCVK